jgi:hypothetical protein
MESCGTRGLVVLAEGGLTAVVDVSQMERWHVWSSHMGLWIAVSFVDGGTT